MFVLFFKLKKADDVLMSDWISDVVASDLCRDRDAGMHRAIFVRRPAHEREGRAGTEGDDYRAAAEDALGCNTAEADPLLDAPFDPGQFDLREAAVQIGRAHV